MKVKFIASSESQVNWGGNDDPAALLTAGVEYELLREEVHSWHTKYILRDFPDKKFNSCSFEPARIYDGYNAYDADKEKP